MYGKTVKESAIWHFEHHNYLLLIVLSKCHARSFGTFMSYSHKICPGKSEPSDFSDRRLWFFYQTALIILSVGSDVMYDVALHQFVEYLLPRIWEPILCLYPLAKQCIPLGREVCCWRILPRVYVLITCLLCISERGGAHPSVACYSNISSDPWHDGWWMTDYHLRPQPVSVVFWT